jgi:uncharacterized protein YrrD
MFHKLNDLKGTDIAARDGSLGDVHDLLFDDHSWKVRYLVVDTGNWLPGRRVLISPASIDRANSKGGKVSLDLTKKEIKDSPGIDADAPVSRQNEIALADHFRWPYYWDAFPATFAATPLIPMMQTQGEAAGPRPGSEEDFAERGDPNLRSAREVVGYHVAASDGDIGHIQDLLFSEEDWTLRFLVIDTRNWLPGRKVLAAPAWIRGIDWSQQKLLVESDKKTIEQAPRYEAGMDIDAALERRIFAHYGRSAEAAE